MRHIPLVFGLSVAFVLLSAAIAANIGGQMPEMREAWVASVDVSRADQIPPRRLSR
jgi:uncharacterized membrane protein YqhA